MGKVAGFVFSVIAARAYGADGWGAFVIALAVLVMIKNIGMLGLNFGLLKLLSELAGSGDFRAARFYTSAAIALVSFAAAALALTGAFFLPTLSRMFSGESDLFVGNMQVLLWCAVPYTLLFLCANALRAYERIGAYAFLLFVLPYGLASVLLASSPAAELSASWLSVFFACGISTAAVVAFATLLRSVWGERGRTGDTSKPASGPIALPTWARLKEVSFPLYVTGFSMIVLGGTDVLFLGYFSTESEAAVYNVAARYAAFVVLGVGAVNSVTAPKIAQAFSRGQEVELERICKQSASMAFIACAPFVVFLALAGRPLLGLYGAEFLAGLPSLYVLIAGYTVNFLCGSVGSVLMMTDQQRLHRNIMLASMSLNLVLGVLLIPRFGALGASIAMAVAMASWNIACLLQVRRLYGFWACFNPVGEAWRILGASR